MTNLIRWVDDIELNDEPAMQNLRLPSGITVGNLCDAATDYLWGASGARYDAHTVTMRPSRLVSDCGCSILNPGADVVGFGPGGLTGFGHDGCGCGGVPEIALPGPVSDLVVTVEGVVLATTEYVVLDGYRLVRIGAYWPCCQRPTDTPGGPGTWSVTFTEGLQPPPLGRMAARELAIELGQYHSGKTSKLPKGVSTITRTGVTMQLGQPKRRTDGQTGTTGMPTVELFLDLANPRRRQQRPLVLSPDTLVGGRTP